MSSAAIPDNRVDPTGTHTLREQYRRHLQRPFNDLVTDVRRGVIEEDVFGLAISQADVLWADLQADALDHAELPPLMRLDRDERKRELFDDWLDKRIDGDVLETIDRGENEFVRSAYSRGSADADRMLRAAGIDVPQGASDDIFRLGVHRRAVEDLFAQNFADLEDITDEMSRQIGEELAEGFAAGDNPRTMARRITDRVDAIGKTRAETLARTRIIDAHSTSTLNRFEQFGITKVTVRAEWTTAADDRVCPICVNLEGQTWTTQEARTGTIQLDEADVADAVPEGRSASEFTGTFPIRPPAHPRCRCSFVPELV